MSEIARVRQVEPHTLTAKQFAAVTGLRERTIKRRHAHAASQPYGPTSPLLWRASYVKAMTPTGERLPYRLGDAAEILELSQRTLERVLAGLGRMVGRTKLYSREDIVAAARRHGGITAAAICKLMPCTMPQLYSFAPEPLEAKPWVWGEDALEAIEAHWRDPKAFLEQYARMTREEWDAVDETTPGFKLWALELEASRERHRVYVEQRREDRKADDARRLPRRMAIKHNIPLMQEYAALVAEYRHALPQRQAAILQRQADIDAAIVPPNRPKAVAAWWALRH